MVINKGDELREQLMDIRKIAENMKKILNSLMITTKKLIESDWSDRKRELKTFLGPLLSSTPRKASYLFTMSLRLGDILITINSDWFKKGKTVAYPIDLIRTFQRNHDNIMEYCSDILQKLSKRKESEIYAALRDLNKKKPQEALDKLYDEMISLYKIIDLLETMATNFKMIKSKND